MGISVLRLSSVRHWGSLAPPNTAGRGSGTCLLPLPVSRGWSCSERDVCPCVLLPSVVVLCSHQKCDFLCRFWDVDWLLWQQWILKNNPVVTGPSAFVLTSFPLKMYRSVLFICFPRCPLLNTNWKKKSDFWCEIVPWWTNTHWTKINYFNNLLFKLNANVALQSFKANKTSNVFSMLKEDLCCVHNVIQ